MSEEILREAHGSGRNLEEAFFARHDAELTEQIRQKQKKTHDKEALSQATGIQDETVLEELYDIGMTTQTIAALSLVPLLEVAWADGTIDEEERKAVLEACGEEGIKPDTPAYNLLEQWMTQPAPDLRKVWADYVTALCRATSTEVRDLIRGEVMGRARKVAQASGGFLGLGNKISRVEKDLIKELEDFFDHI